MEVTRLFDYLAFQATERPDPTFFILQSDRRWRKKWKSYTFKEVADICDKVSQALLNMGIKKMTK
jgi:acyl-CoA synthetase (AMP-forming)/AMP-acid ligase II